MEQLMRLSNSFVFSSCSLCIAVFIHNNLLLSSTGSMSIAWELSLINSVARRAFLRRPEDLRRVGDRFAEGLASLIENSGRDVFETEEVSGAL